MVGKVGMTPAFKGTIIVPAIKRNDPEGLKFRRIRTEHINTIQKQGGYTLVETSNYGDLFVPTKLAPTHNIVTAYAAAKNDLVTVDARA